MPWVAICARARTGCGRDRNKTYVNAIKEVRRIKTDAATFVANNPTHPWADPGYNEYIVDIPDAFGEAAFADNREIFHDGYGNLPRWQNRNAGSASAYLRGRFTDPEDSQSVFTVETDTDDDRWIVRLYDGDPGSGGTHIEVAELDEGQGAGSVTYYLKLFNPDDTPSSTNAQDQKVEIGGVLFRFDFTSGVSTIDVDTTVAGVTRFPSNYSYRHIGPGGAHRTEFRIYSNTLKVRR